MLLLAFKYIDNPEAALIVNANLGGDNVHRGALLGALLGAARPAAILGEACALRRGLAQSPALLREARRFSELARSPHGPTWGLLHAV